MIKFLVVDTESESIHGRCASFEEAARVAEEAALEVAKENPCDDVEIGIYELKGRAKTEIHSKVEAL